MLFVHDEGMRVASRAVQVRVIQRQVPVRVLEGVGRL